MGGCAWTAARCVVSRSASQRWRCSFLGSAHSCAAFGHRDCAQRWVHVAFVLDGAPQLQLLIDGSVVATGSFALATSASNVIIGARAVAMSSSQSHFQGFMGEQILFDVHGSDLNPPRRSENLESSANSGARLCCFSCLIFRTERDPCRSLSADADVSGARVELQHADERAGRAERHAVGLREPRHATESGLLLLEVPRSVRRAGCRR